MIELHKPNAVCRQKLAASLVVKPALLAAMNSADSESIWLIEKSNGPGVLNLSVFDREFESGVISIDR